MELVFVAVSAAVFVYLLILILFHDPSKAQIRRRVSKLSENVNMDQIHDEVIKEKQRKINENKKGRLISQKLVDYLAAAGVKLNAKEFLYSWIAAVLLPSLLMIVLGRNVLSVLAAGIIGFAVPPLLVRRSRKKRQELFMKQLGQSLAIMSNSIKSGYSFQQAMQSIANDMQPPISTEFSKTIREMHYGVSLEDALNHLVERVQNKDLALLISAVITSSQVGSNLSEIIDTISVTIKDRAKIRDDVRNLSAQGRISGLIIGLLPIIICLMLMLANPTYVMQFFDDDIGKIMIVVGIVLELIGFMVINKIVDIKY